MSISIQSTISHPIGATLGIGAPSKSPKYDGWIGVTPDTQFMAHPRWQAILWRRQVYRAIDAVRAFRLPVIPD